MRNLGDKGCTAPHDLIRSWLCRWLTRRRPSSSPLSLSMRGTLISLPTRWGPTPHGVEVITGLMSMRHIALLSVRLYALTKGSCDNPLAICRYQMLSWTHAWRRILTQRWALILPIFAAQMAAWLPALGASSLAPCTKYLRPCKSPRTDLQTLSGTSENPLKAQLSCLQVACETATKTNMVMVFGEITTSAKVDYEKVVRDTCREIGFISDDVGLDADKCKVSRPPFTNPADATLCRLGPHSLFHAPALGVY